MQFLAVCFFAHKAVLQKNVYFNMCPYFRKNTYIKAVYELSNLINLRFRIFPYHNDLIFYLSPHGFRYRKACMVAHSHTGKNQKQGLVIWTIIGVHIFCSAEFMFYTLVCYSNIHNLVFWRRSNQKEKRSTKERKGAGAHTGQEKLGFSGHSPVCKSEGFFPPRKPHCCPKLV